MLMMCCLSRRDELLPFENRIILGLCLKTFQVLAGCFLPYRNIPSPCVETTQKCELFISLIETISLYHLESSAVKYAHTKRFTTMSKGLVLMAFKILVFQMDFVCRYYKLYKQSIHPAKSFMYGFKICSTRRATSHPCHPKEVILRRSQLSLIICKNACCLRVSLVYYSHVP